VITTAVITAAGWAPAGVRVLVLGSAGA